MDDIYFSDNKKKNNTHSNNSAKASQDKFVQADYYDESFNLKFKSKGNAQSFSNKGHSAKSFSVNIPDDEGMPMYEADKRDRTPKGRAVSEISDVNPPEYTPESYTAQPHSRASHASQYTPQHAAPSSRANSTSRTPRGNRVAAPQHAHQRASASNMHNRPSGGSGKRSGRRKSSSGGKIALGFLCLLLILIVGVGAFCMSAINSLNYDDSIVPNQYINHSELYSSDSLKNILFIGSDARGDVDGQRSDTMILFSIDQQNGQIKLTSFLRDSYVYIPSKGYKTKLNSAFSYGGTQLVIDTIEYNFGIDIDHYVMVSFDAFQQLIDLMGGLTIEGVTAKEAQYMNNVVDIKSVKEGTNKMNGFTALWYCRIRKLDSDFYRTQRQRKVISAVVNQAKKTNPFTLANICKQVLPNISTDIDKSEMTTLAVGAALSFLRYDIVQMQIPADGTWSSQRINGSEVLAMNIDTNKRLLKEFLSTKYVEQKDE